MCVEMKVMSSRAREHREGNPSVMYYNTVLNVRLDWMGGHCFTAFCLNWRPIGPNVCASFHVNMKPENSDRLPPGGIPSELVSLIGNDGLTALLKQAFSHVKPEVRDLFELVPESLHRTYNGDAALNITMR